MMRLAGKLSLVLTAALVACAPLERPGLPIWPGATVTDSCHAFPAQALQQAEDLGLGPWFWEVELLPDDAGLPHLPAPTRACLVHRLAATPHTDALGLTLGPGLRAAPPTDTAWWQAFGRALVAVDAAVGTQVQDPLVVFATKAWASLAVAHLPESAGPARFTLALPTVEALDWGGWDALPVIALDNTPTPDGHPKAWARTWHPKLAALSVRLGKPLWLARLNATGANKVWGLRNALRFWPDSTPHLGLVLNTLYDRPAILDTLTPFGWGGDDAAADFIRQYTARGQALGAAKP